MGKGGRGGWQEAEGECGVASSSLSFSLSLFAPLCGFWASNVGLRARQAWGWLWGWLSKSMEDSLVRPASLPRSTTIPALAL
eukprot:3249647-Rhodomonas_salina.2